MRAFLSPQSSRIIFHQSSSNSSSCWILCPSLSGQIISNHQIIQCSTRSLSSLDKSPRMWLRSLTSISIVLYVFENEDEAFSQGPALKTRPVYFTLLKHGKRLRAFQFKNRLTLENWITIFSCIYIKMAVCWSLGQFGNQTAQVMLHNYFLVKKTAPKPLSKMCCQRLCDLVSLNIQAAILSHIPLSCFLSESYSSNESEEANYFCLTHTFHSFFFIVLL